jgi:integrase
MGGALADGLAPRYECQIKKAATHTPASRPSKNSSANLTNHFRRLSMPTGGRSTVVRARSPAAIDLCPGNYGRSDDTKEFGRSFGRAGNESWQCCVRLLVLTGQRRGEVAGMNWREISGDLSTWTMPRGAPPRTAPPTWCPTTSARLEKTPK